MERFKCCENIELLAKKHGVPWQTLYRWHEQSERAECSKQKLRGAIAGPRAGLGNLVVRGDGEEGRVRFGAADVGELDTVL